MTNFGTRFAVSGAIYGSVKLICNRCAEEYIWGFNIPVNEEFFDIHEKKSYITEGEDPDSQNFFFYENDIIDFKEMIRQNILSSIPIKTICSENCNGIVLECAEDDKLSKDDILKEHITDRKIKK